MDGGYAQLTEQFDCLDIGSRDSADKLVAHEN
jgi:hypothetical protein